LYFCGLSFLFLARCPNQKRRLDITTLCLGFLGLRLQTFILPVCQEGALPFNHNRVAAHTVAWRGSDNLPNPTPARILLQQAVEQKPLDPNKSGRSYLQVLFSQTGSDQKKWSDDINMCVCLCLQSK